MENQTIEEKADFREFLDFKKTQKTKKKRGAKPIGDHVLTGGEISRRQAQKYQMIDDQLNKARSEINWERRNAAESDIVLWINTYCIGHILDTPPSPKCEEILHEMHKACIDKRPYLISMARGSGKTSYIECLTSFLLATGKKKFVVIVSQNASSSFNILNDIFRFLTDDGTPITTDYPDVSLPFIIANGAYRRVNSFNGTIVDIHKTESKLVIARIVEKDGTEAPTSHSVVECRGITSGLRGLKMGSRRPDLVLLDDIQDDESAQSQERIQKLKDIIKKTILNLGKSGQKISVLQSATPICDEDLVCQLFNDKAWKTSKYPAIIKWPTDIIQKPDNGLWRQYFDMYDCENATDSTHENSTGFYKENQKEMDEGCELLNPTAYDNSEHISALQALMDKYHQIGESAFFSEYQMQPKRISIEVQLNPTQVLTHMDKSRKEFEVPDGYNLICGTLDLNTSYAATLLLGAYNQQGTLAILTHRIYKMCIDQNLGDIQYSQELYKELVKIMNRIKQYGIDIDCLGIDCNSRNWNTVLEFCKTTRENYGISSCGMAGQSGITFSPQTRSRLREAVGRTILCGNPKEHIKKGSGLKWVFFDADFYKEQSQKAFLLAPGSQGTISLYSSFAVQHKDFALQVCNEKLVWKKTTAKGTEYHWKSKEPHDYLDCLSMMNAVCTIQGINQEKSLKQQTAPIPTDRNELVKYLLKRKRKIKLV
ncbi:MAG: phage terminase large subunit family protein [Kiritimatiellae bacterium]|nr:phage terminase large subunit family protein [Kiritimatiellia bacterium]